jgi:hypothetical protein
MKYIFDNSNDKDCRIVVLYREKWSWIESQFTEGLFEVSLWSFPLDFVEWDGITVKRIEWA